MNISLYLSQSYKDAWEDYCRTLRNCNFPGWDYIILTASNAHQAEVFRLQTKARRAYIPGKTQVVIIPDEGGIRVGSGGATFSVLKWLKENGGWAGKRILVIHSGGDSKRVPQYSALGKLFSPVPHILPDGRSSTLFDEFLIAMSSVPSRIREGMLLLSGDVLLLFNPLLIDWPGHGAAVISFKENVQTGKNHGVYLRGEDGNVKAFLHKQSEETLRMVGAVNDHGDVDIDTGSILLGTDVLDSLFSLISTEGASDPEKYSAFVNDHVRLSLYGDFQYPMATDSTLLRYYNEEPEGEVSEELSICRTALWNALHSYKLKLLRLAPAKFIHFGTSKEVQHLFSFGVEDYASLDWSSRINSAGSCAAYNSVIEPEVTAEQGVYAEVSYLHGKTKVGENSIISYVDLEDEEIPANVVLHGLKQSNGKFVVRIYGIEDNPKGNKLFGIELTGNLWDYGEAHTLWNARIFPECDTIGEAVKCALTIHFLMINTGKVPRNAKSLASGFADADPKAIIAWDKRMAELVQMENIASMIRNKVPAKAARLTDLTPIQTEWMNQKLTDASFSDRLRLKYYVDTALGAESIQAFNEVSSSILGASLDVVRRNTDCHIIRDELKVDLPLRVNFGGGWSDTPPYCNENGGTVLNAAITLNGDRPVKVKLKRIDEHKIILESRDMNVYGEFKNHFELYPGGDPYDPFVLQKAALMACGIVSIEDRDMDEICSRLGGGFMMNTEVVGVPKGSGLGTSSILAAAVVKGLFEFLGISYTENKLYEIVLAVEQIMSTGGGWQDQVGGMTDGIKYITSRPGLKQEIKVQHIELDPETRKELDDRFALIYTGQRRLARNLLRDVMGRYIGNEPDAVYALNEIQRNATLQRFELERGNIDAFAELMSQHWELSKMLDSGSTNTLIDQIFDACDDLLDGKMICGAGGGGFLQVVLKKNVTKDQLQKRLKSVFSDTAIGVWDCELV